MSNLLDYFGAAYLINLPERKDRLKSATKEFGRVGWVLGPGGVQLYAAQRSIERAGFSSPSVQGCFCSHFECISRAHQQGRKSILLMEDDIALSPAIHRLTPSIISQLEVTPWDFFYLGHGRTGDIGHANSHTAEITLAPMTAEIGGTHFYAINGRIFARLLAHLDRVRTGIEGDQEFGPMPLDGAYNVFRRKNSDTRTLIAMPKLGWQRPSRSDISPRPIDKLKVLRPVLSLLRSCKHAMSQWRFERS
jgi:glycosyl transferase, family 25